MIKICLAFLHDDIGVPDLFAEPPCLASDDLIPLLVSALTSQNIFSFSMAF